MTPVAPEAAVLEIQEALGCECLVLNTGDELVEWCRRHHIQSGRWTDRGCPVAVKAADAAVAPIAAWVLREAAEDMSARLDTFPQQGRNTRAGWAENWLRARAVTWPLGGDRP